MEARLAEVQDRLSAADEERKRMEADAESLKKQADDYHANSQRELAEAKKACDALASRLSALQRSEEHTSELQSLMRISYAVFCLKKKHIYSTNKPAN